MLKTLNSNFLDWEDTLTVSHVFYFQNLICFWLWTSKLRFWCIDTSFWFTISRDMKSWIRNSDFEYLQTRAKNRVSFSDLITEIYLQEIVILWQSPFPRKTFLPQTMQNILLFLSVSQLSALSVQSKNKLWQNWWMYYFTGLKDFNTNEHKCRYFLVMASTVEPR